MSVPLETLTIEDERERFYAALGKAITQWQHVEAAVGRIFSNAISITEHEATNHAFYAIISFDTKLYMTDCAVCASSITKSKLDRWKPLYNKANRRNKRRNYLAHYMLEIDETRRPGYRVHLRPSGFNGLVAKQYGDNPPRLITDQVIASGNAFDTLASELGEFARFIWGERILEIVGPIGATAE